MKYYNKPKENYGLNNLFLINFKSYIINTPYMYNCLHDCHHKPKLWGSNEFSCAGCRALCHAVC